MCTGTDQAFPTPKNQNYPSNEDLSVARQNDQAYGDPAAGYMTPGNANLRIVPKLTTSMKLANNDMLSEVPTRPIDQEMSDTTSKAWLAAQRSPIMSLGFDPRAMTTSPKKGNEDLKININGSYTPSSDEIWTSGQYDSTIVHESVHRALEKLRKANMMPPLPGRDFAKVDLDGETVTRAFMAKYFGDIEKGRGEKSDEQVTRGQRILKEYGDYLSKIEESAAKLIAKERPRGPR